MSKKKIVALMTAVRDLQVRTKGPESEEDDYMDYPDAEAFLFVKEGDPEALTKQAAEFAMTDPENIRLIELDDSDRYVAAIKPFATRDGQFCTSADTDPLGPNWQDLPLANIYIGVFQGSREQTVEDAAWFTGCATEDIRTFQL